MHEQWLGENERAVGQEKDARKEGYHFDNLFDQNEDETGEKINLATGEQIRNDQDIEAPHIGELSQLQEDDRGLQAIKKELENDPATEWLLKNGYNEDGTKKAA